MYCIKCGADNLDTAQYCRKCGEDVGSQQAAVRSQPEEIEEETRVVTRSPMSKVQSPNAGTAVVNEEAELFSISPTLFFVKAGYVGAAIGALLLVGFTSLLLSSYVSPWLSVVLGLLLFLVPAFYHVRQKLTSYLLTESKLEIDSGFISRTTRNVPLRRIQDVTVSATPWQRLFGIGDLMIDNASDEGGKLVLKNINKPKVYADKLLEQMRRLER
ncbi:MAG: PH domain-containing protein [Pyrinomonadaceae bacterium]